ncbi:MAG: hypothetical protein ACREBE_09880, partial [bacterium]
MQYSHSHRDSAGQSSAWMSYVVLWRGQAGWGTPRSGNPAVAAEMARQQMEAQLAVMAADRVFMGGSNGSISYGSEIDRRGSRLYLLGQEYAIPERDSALVIMIDRVDGIGGPPVVVAAAVIDGRLPPEVQSKTWISGETTF